MVSTAHDTSETYAMQVTLQVVEAAAQLGVDRTSLSKVLNGRAAISAAISTGISTATALRLERWLARAHGGAAEVRPARRRSQQAVYELWQARAAVKVSKALSGNQTLQPASRSCKAIAR